MKITNRNLSLDTVRALDLKGETISEHSGFIQPTLIIEPLTTLLFTAGRTTTGTLTAGTTALDKDTYITGIDMSMIKDVVCDQATGRLSLLVPQNSKATNVLCAIPILTLTAQQYSNYIQFKTPLKVDRNAVISMVLTFAAGAMSVNIQIYGFTRETITGSL